MNDDTTYRRYDFEDVSGQPFSFEGYELAFASSQVDDDPKPRWMELRLLKTRNGAYVREVVGQTSIPGEVVKSRAHVHHSADELIDALHSRRRDHDTGELSEPYLTYTVRDALYDAMDHDDELKNAWESRVREVA